MKSRFQDKLYKLRRQFRALGVGVISLVAAASFNPIHAQPAWESLGIPDNPGGNGCIAAKDGVLYVGDKYYSNDGSHNPDWTLQRWTASDLWQTISDISGGNNSTYIDATVSTMFIAGDDLYVGGNFTYITNSSTHQSLYATNLAKYNTVSGQWSIIGDNSFTDYNISAIAVDSRTNVYVASSIETRDYSEPVLRVWNGSSWQTVGGGLIYPAGGRYDYATGVRCLAVDGTNLYVGGAFDGASNGTQRVYSYDVIKWNGSSWSAMGTAYPPIGDPSDSNNWPQFYDDERDGVWSIAVSGGKVLAVGSFAQDYTETNYPYGIAEYSTEGAWIPLTNALMSQIYSPYATPGTGFQVAARNGTFYIVGDFAYVGDERNIDGTAVNAWGVAQWTNGILKPVGVGEELDPGIPPMPSINCVAADASDVFVSEGSFTTVWNAGVPETAYGIARYGNPPNVAPTVVITSPANGAVYMPLATFTINATASDSDGTITSVDIFTNGVKACTVSVPPYGDLRPAHRDDRNRSRGAFLYRPVESS